MKPNIPTPVVIIVAPIEYIQSSMLTAGDEITENMKLSVEEVKALSRFLALEDDRRAFEAIKYYLPGGRAEVEMMELLGIL